MLSPEAVDKALIQAQTSASHSWEYGTVCEELLEHHTPSHSIFNEPFADGHIPVLDEDEVPALTYVKSFILTDSDKLCEGHGNTVSLPTFNVEHISRYTQAHQPTLHR